MRRHCTIRPVRPKSSEAIRQLSASCGPDASDMARILAFRAEAGLLHEATPGFWTGVAQAVAHRLGVPDQTQLGTNLLAL